VIDDDGCARSISCIDDFSIVALADLESVSSR